MMKVFLTPTPTEHPKLIVKTVVDFAWTADHMYKKTDAYTFSHTIKKKVALLYVEPILF
ncbi:hypothetical protein SEVIR_6G046101v4 [Setaria viridis]